LISKLETKKFKKKYLKENKKNILNTQVKLSKFITTKKLIINFFKDIFCFIV